MTSATVSVASLHHFRISSLRIPSTQTQRNNSPSKQSKRSR